jgi:catechol-2,3-dioxygenase
VVSVEVAGAGSITFAYLTDPEGNIVEVQRWS